MLTVLPPTEVKVTGPDEVAALCSPKLETSTGSCVNPVPAERLPDDQSFPAPKKKASDEVTDKDLVVTPSVVAGELIYPTASLSASDMIPVAVMSQTYKKKASVPGVPVVYVTLVTALGIAREHPQPCTWLGIVVKVPGV